MALKRLVARHVHAVPHVYRRASDSDVAKSLEIERTFVPPHCPESDCPSRAGLEFRWRREGWRKRNHAPYLVQRFRCLDCDRIFSTQTFRTTYWAKRPDLDARVYELLISGCSNRQIGRFLHCGKSTVARTAIRLGRHSLRFTVKTFKEKGLKVGGNVVFDGFQSFEHSQWHPYWLNVIVHADSDLALGVTASPLRRSGRLTPEQRERRPEIDAAWRPPPDTIYWGTAELLSNVREFLDLPTTTLVSDKHLDYPGAIYEAGLDALPHERIDSKAPRTAWNRLFPVNLLDLILRHNGAAHKRETIAFGRRRMAALEKAWIQIVSRNFMQPRRVKNLRKRTPWPTPAMLAGIATSPLTYDDIFARRIFDEEVELPHNYAAQVRRYIFTPIYDRNEVHELRFAY